MSYENIPIRKFYNIKVGKSLQRGNCHGSFSKLHSRLPHNLYKKVWTATVEEALVCEREPKNSSDRYAVAVKNEANITDHLARKL